MNFSHGKRIILQGILFSILCEVITSYLVPWDEDEERYVRRQKINKFEPTWSSLDKRKAPKWFDEAKVGIFIHWGVYSVPSFGSEWFWNNLREGNYEYVDFMEGKYPMDFEYQDFARDFKAEMFDPHQWASILQASGAKYFVFTSKHHDGFANWPSNYSWNWNSVDIGPHQDLVGALEKAVRERTTLKFGLYFSLYEWFNPTYRADKNNNFRTQNFVKYKIVPQLKDLVTRYRPEYLWSDGDWEATSSYWNSTEILAWLYNESPVRDTILVNDRWGKDANCLHGDVKTCKDRYLADKLEKFKWENAMTIDKKSWGFRREAPLSDYYSIEALVKLVVRTVSYGGNILINVGPTADGRILPIFEERLRQLGYWLRYNGRAIYRSKPWRKQEDTHAEDVWYTQNDQKIYAIFCTWPQGSTLILKAPRPTEKTSVRLLGSRIGNTIKWHRNKAGGMIIDLRKIQLDNLRSKWAWTIEISHAD